MPVAPAFPGPAALGRGVVVADGGPIPSEFDGAPVVRVDGAVVADPGPTAALLHGHWAARRPVAVVLEEGVAARLAEAEASDAAPHSLTPRFTFEREWLNFAVWANNWDLRSGEAVWWRARKAVRLGATLAGPCDVVLPDGRPAWCDGGPRGPVDVGEAVIHRESIELRRLRAHTGTGTETLPDADLAADQLAAVLHGAGPARVIAPAGSGKTRVLTERLRHVLGARGIEHQLVTTVAYNRKAADELRERTAAFTPNVRTIHSLALWICSMAAPTTVLDERDVRRILDSMLDVRPRANADVIAPYLEAFTAVRIGLRDPEDVEDERDDVPGFADVFEPYRRHLRERGALDFDEQVYRAIELLLSDPTIRAEAQRRCRHLLVDEFQDLTPAYLLLLRLLAAPAFSVFGVGDDDQVIYGHVGADPRFLVEFDSYFPVAQHHCLEVNYRCPPSIVAAADRVLARNEARVAKTIRPAPGRTGTPADLEVAAVATAELAKAATGPVRRWLDAGAEAPQIAVLARVNAALLPVQAGLFEAGVPFTSTLGPDVLGRTGMRTLLAYIRIALAPEDIAAADLTETVRRPSRRLRREAVDLFRRRRRWSLDDLAGMWVASDRDRERLDDFVGDLGLLAKHSPGRTTAEIVAFVRNEIGLGAAMGTLDSSRSAADRSTHVDDLDAAEAAAALCPDPREFEAWLRRTLAAGGEEGVELSSVHRVKGREWPHVVVFGAHDGLLPHHLAYDLEDEEEERRVFHVALTRAVDSAVVLHDASRPAPFVDEMLGRETVRTRRKPPAAAAGSRPLAMAVVAEDAELSGADLELFEALRDWRREQARVDGVPAYVICHDRSLRAVASSRPASIGELAACPGIGPTKLDRYGDDILALVEAAGTEAAGAG